MTPGLTIGGSADVTGGSIVGGDLINVVLHVVQNALPAGDPLPNQFKATLANLDILVSSVRAWKRTHNTLDEIRNRFDPFKRLLELSRSRRRPLPSDQLRNPWRMASYKLEGLPGRLEEVQYVEALFADKQPEMRLAPHSGDTEEVMRKSRQLLDLARHLNRHLAIDGEQVEALPAPSLVRRLAASLLLPSANSAQWWGTLYEWTDDLDSKLTEAMYLTDQVLRLSADGLFEFSQRTLVAH